MQSIIHKSVMCKEIVTYLNPLPGQLFVDCTLGCAGHAEGILKAILPDGRLVGIDQDLEALKVAEQRLEKYSKNLILVHGNFENLSDILKQYNIEKVNGILFDLGVSSLQLDSRMRGFSFQYNGPLDMRMNQDAKITAFDLINNLNESELAKIIWNYGEERLARRIARGIVRERKKGPIVTTLQLANMIVGVVGRRENSKIHPATKTFQAFRIAVNRELEVLEKSLRQAIEFLQSSGRICVISFHSLEDRVVKNVYRKEAHQHKIRILTGKPLFATEQEVSENPCSRSARLRVAEKNKNGELK